jgi:radical SAM-linked protein
VLPESVNAVKTDIKVRVKFSKTGSLKFISHLDLNRTMQSAFLRSKLPVWYSEGFNPHPRVAFTPPLSVGVSSLTEFMDFKMVEEVAPETIVERLNASFPAGLRASLCYAPKAHFRDIKWSLYEIKFELSGKAPEDIEEKTKAALSANEILIEKFSKKGEPKTVNIADGIRFCSGTLAENVFTVNVKLSCDEMAFVNPKYIAEVLEKAMPECFAGAENEVCRMEVYLADGETLFE